VSHAVTGGAGSLLKAPLSAALGPADWTHGITRPAQDAVGRPNPIRGLFRQPLGGPAGAEAASCSTSMAKSACLDVGDSGAVSTANQARTRRRTGAGVKFAAEKRANARHTPFMGVNWI
jgi:hypothetical protein